MSSSAYDKSFPASLMRCTLVYSPLWSQPSDFCHSTAFQFCLLCHSLLTWQSNFLLLLYRSSSYISLLSPRCYWSKNGTEINPELRRPQHSVLPLLQATMYECNSMPFTQRTFWKGLGLTTGCADKPVIQILQLCFSLPFPLLPALCTLFSAVLSVASLCQ